MPNGKRTLSPQAFTTLRKGMEAPITPTSLEEEFFKGLYNTIAGISAGKAQRAAAEAQATEMAFKAEITERETAVKEAQAKTAEELAQARITQLKRVPTVKPPKIPVTALSVKDRLDMLESMLITDQRGILDIAGNLALEKIPYKSATEFDAFTGAIKINLDALEKREKDPATLEQIKRVKALRDSKFGKQEVDDLYSAIETLK